MPKPIPEQMPEQMKALRELAKLPPKKARAPYKRKARALSMVNTNTDLFIPKKKKRKRDIFLTKIKK